MRFVEIFAPDLPRVHGARARLLSGEPTRTPGEHTTVCVDETDAQRVGLGSWWGHFGLIEVDNLGPANDSIRPAGEAALNRRAQKQ